MRPPGSRALLCAATVLAVAASARAAEPRNVVVFPPEVESSDLEQADLHLFQRSLENDLGPALASSGYTVLTDENAHAMLRRRNIDLDAVRQSHSYLEAARAAQLSLFTTTQITGTGGSLVADIRLFDVASGNMIASEEIEGDDGATLRQAWKKERDRFIEQARQGLSARPTGDGALTERVSADELKEIRAGCERSEPSKCLRLGQLYERGVGVTADPEQAVEYYGRACSGGYPEGCAALHALRDRL